MRWGFLLIVLSMTTLAAVLPAQAQVVPPPRGSGLVPVHQLTNFGGDNLYTTDTHEVDVVQRQGYTYGGVAFYAGSRPGPDLVPLYRYSQFGGSHFYSTSPRVRGLNVQREGIVGFIGTRPGRGLASLHDWYNPDTGAHLYTTDPGGEYGPSEGFVDSGVVGYVMEGR